MNTYLYLNRVCDTQTVSQVSVNLDEAGGAVFFIRITYFFIILFRIKV